METQFSRLRSIFPYGDDTSRDYYHQCLRFLRMENIHNPTDDQIAAEFDRISRIEIEIDEDWG